MVYHRVKSGDTLGKIARMYGTTVNELCRLNGIKSTSMLRLGQSIRCSAGRSASVAAKPEAKQTTAKATTTAAKTTKTTTVEAATPVASLTGNASATQTADPVYHLHQKRRYVRCISSQIRNNRKQVVRNERNI